MPRPGQSADVFGNIRVAGGGEKLTRINAGGGRRGPGGLDRLHLGRIISPQQTIFGKNIRISFPDAGRASPSNAKKPLRPRPLYRNRTEPSPSGKERVWAGQGQKFSSAACRRRRCWAGRTTKKERLGSRSPRRKKKVIWCWVYPSELIQ